MQNFNVIKLSVLIWSNEREVKQKDMLFWISDKQRWLYARIWIRKVLIRILMEYFKAKGEANKRQSRKLI